MATPYESGVARLYDEFLDLRNFLDETTAARYVPVIEDVFPKTMLVAAASYFETRLSHDVEQLVKDATSENHVVLWLVRNKAVQRQYHNWFAWDGQNANQFFSMFGKDFKQRALEWINEDDTLRTSIANFIEIGRVRNQLVHGNFSDFTMEKTAKEVFELYESAKTFVDWFPAAIRRYSEMPNAG